MRIKDIFGITSIPVIVASLCCLSPVILVLAGVGTATFAASLADTLYGDYAWYFRGAGIIALLIAFFIYVRRAKGICTIDEAKRRRNEIINMFALVFIAGVVGYLFFLYVIVHYAGVFLNLWQ